MQQSSTLSLVKLPPQQIKHLPFLYTVFSGLWAMSLGKSSPVHLLRLFSFHWSYSPLIGGALADPANEYPRLFDRAFFRDYPYFLPCFVTGLVAFAVGLATFFFLEETLPSKRPYQRVPSQPEQEHDTVSLLEAPPPSTVVQLLRIPVIRALSVSGAFLCFTATAFDALFVIFCYTPITLGGLNFSVRIFGPTFACSLIAQFQW